MTNNQPHLAVTDRDLEGLFVAGVIVNVAKPLAYALLDTDDTGLIHTAYAIYTDLVERVLDRHTVLFHDHDVDIDGLVKSVWTDALYETKTVGGDA